MPASISRGTVAGACTQFGFMALIVGVLMAMPSSAEARSVSSRGVAYGSIEVTLIDTSTGQALPGVEVTALERGAAKSLRWRGRARTDASGHASFELPGLGQQPGKPYVFRAKPFGQRVTSPVVEHTGSFSFEVGTISFKVIDPISAGPYAGRAVHLRRVVNAQKTKWVAMAVTDEAGRIRLDPASGYPSSTRYVLKARSPVSGRWRSSDEFVAPGRGVFEVGGTPLAVTLFDAQSELRRTLPGERIDAYALSSTGRLKWLARGYTDEAGKVLFDIPGLGDADGPTVLLRTRAMGMRSWSEPIRSAGDVDYGVGRLALTVRHPGSGEPLPGHRVILKKLLPDGRHRQVANARSDADGVVRFDPLGLGSGTQFVAVARSPISRRYKTSAPIDAPGKVDFAVGSPPLQILALDALSGQALPGLKLYAQQQRDNGTYRWADRGRTDDRGRLDLDLDGLGDGAVYRIKSVPFKAGTVYSAAIDSAGAFELKLGTSPVVLSDALSGEALAGKYLVARRVADDGALITDRKGKTDAMGMVRFDLPGIDAGVRYIIETYNPFGRKRKFHTPTITAPGLIEFAVSAKDDLEPPVVVIERPSASDVVNVNGFVVSGTASDNKQVSSVTVRFGDVNLPADYDAQSGRFSVAVGAELLTPGPLQLQVVAIDGDANEALTSADLLIGADEISPLLSIDSHNDGQSVSATGFVISGAASDDSGRVNVALTLIDPLLGRPLDGVSVPVLDGAGQWSIAIRAGDISTGSTIRIAMSAVDASGNQSVTQVSLNVVAVDPSVRQLINRLTFGPTQSLLERLTDLGAAGFVDEQLDAQAQDEVELEQALQALGAVDDSNALQTWQVLHAIHSRNQLREVLTVFWDNHFNTDSRARNSGFENTIDLELAQNQAFRANALGRFRDLLDISTRSPSMLIYLDGVSNVAANPNENLPRELLELSTLGIDGGYTQEDVEEVARALTGWTVRDGAFFFDSSVHDSGQKVVLGNVIAAGGGVADGEQVLDILATHPSTANFICTKLTALLLDDAPLPTLVDACAARFLAASGDADQVAQLVRLIVESPEFSMPTSRWSKIKTPLEFTAGVARAFEAEGDGTDLAAMMRNMGMDLFRNPVPTGYAEQGAEWINSARLLERLKAVDRIAFAAPAPARTSISPRAFMLRHGALTAEAVIGVLFDLTLGENYSALEWDTAMGVLTDYGATPFAIGSADADARIRAVIGTVVGFPGYQFQ